MQGHFRQKSVHKSRNQQQRNFSRDNIRHRASEQIVDEGTAIERIEGSQSDDVCFKDLHGFDISLKPGQSNIVIDGMCCPDRWYNPNSSEIIRGDSSEVDSEGYQNLYPLIPGNVVVSGQKIDRIQVADIFRPGSKIDVVVVGIYDLSKFWISINFPKLEEFMEDIQSYYVWNSEDYVIPLNLLKKNLYCVASLHGVFSRALIVNWRADIDQNFSRLPAQAVRARLDGVRPPYQGMPWSAEACRNFRDMTFFQKFSAEVTEIDVWQNVVNVRLNDIHDVSMSSVLATNGHAIFNRIPQKKTVTDTKCEAVVSYFHHYPIFDDLENWNVPWHFETHFSKKTPVTLDFLQPQYFKKPINVDSIDRIEKKMELSVRKKKPLRKHFKKCDLDSKTDMEELNKIVYGALYEPNRKRLEDREEENWEIPEAEAAEGIKQPIFNEFLVGKMRRSRMDNCYAFADRVLPEWFLDNIL